jgi:hypothetical protein
MKFGWENCKIQFFRVSLVNEKEAIATHDPYTQKLLRLFSAAGNGNIRKRASVVKAEKADSVADSSSAAFNGTFCVHL